MRYTDQVRSGDGQSGQERVGPEVRLGLRDFREDLVDRSIDLRRQRRQLRDVEGPQNSWQNLLSKNNKNLKTSFKEPSSPDTIRNELFEIHDDTHPSKRNKKDILIKPTEKGIINQRSNTLKTWLGQTQTPLII